MIKTTFKITKMDCPCEESLIRMKLQEFTHISRLDFDLNRRTLTVTHAEEVEALEKSIASLNLDSHLLGSTAAEENGQTLSDSDREQRSCLLLVLGINFAFFVIEMTTGFFSRSMGLVADSLDMLADAVVYGLSLFVVGAAAHTKRKVARLSGYFQILLAVLGIIEVIKRFAGFEEPPHYRTMMIVSFLALLANWASLYIIQRVKKQEAHIQASVIFSSNDIIINAGVILAGALVWWLDSKLPDLIVGAIVFVIVLRGAWRILKLAK